MTTPFSPDPIQSVTPQVSPITTTTTIPEQQPVTPKQLNSAELLFALSCYCYITASKLGHDALNVLDENLVRVQELTEIGTQEASGLSIEFTDAEKDLESSKLLAAEIGDTVIEPDMEAVDSESAAEETQSAIIPTNI